MMKLKKIIAAAASVVMACAFATSAFAATTNMQKLVDVARAHGYSEADVKAVVTSEDQATKVVGNKDFYKARYNTVTTATDAGVAAQAANEAAAQLSTDTGKTVAASVSVSGNRVVVNATVKDASGNVLLTKSIGSANVTSEHPEIGEAIKNGTWGVDEKKATAASATVSAPNRVIKATGDNTAVVLMMGALAIVGVLGLAVRKSDAEA